MLAVVSVGVVLLCVIDALVLLHQYIHQLLCCVYLHNHSDGFSSALASVTWSNVLVKLMETNALLMCLLLAPPTLFAMVCPREPLHLQQ